jgi:hypothetical protein
VGKLSTPIAMGIAAGVCALVVARGCSRGLRGYEVGTRATAPTTLAGRATSFTFHPETSRISVRSLDGVTARDLELSLVVDGVPRPIELGRDEVVVSNGERGVLFHVDFERARTEAMLLLHLDRGSDALVATLSVASMVALPVGGETGIGADVAHKLALRVELPTEGRTSFVSGVGEIGDLVTVSGSIATIDADPRTLGIVSTHGLLQVSQIADEPAAAGAPMRLAVSSPEVTLAPDQRVSTDLRLVLAPSSAAAWGTLHQLAGDVTARVRGIVTGTRESARVFGLDAEGAPQVLAVAEPNGRFVLDVPKTVVQWYAAIDASRTSAPVTFSPGTGWDLRLDVSPGGELRIRITDADTGLPLTARLIVHGIEGTLDPSFGPDYRASGAGPIIDALRGEVATPLPVGRYRVSATKGIEWSIDAKTIEIAAGRTATAELAPRHVIATPGVVGCDLHVHARPSFDSPVLPEDRVLSLVAAGVDFAVPSEHNIVGDYGPMLATLELTRDLAYVTGVEITTYNPRFGHFGLFPYPINRKLPPYRGTSPAALFSAAKRGDPSRILQVNHPRLPHAIGYFDVYRFDPNAPRPPPGLRLDFDSIEVYNGYDLAKPDRVDAVLRDYFALLNQGHRYIATGSSDSHRIQYQWAGYPRTMITVGEEAGGDKGRPVDPQAVVAALKKGHAIVTSGPYVDLEVAGAHPGDELFTTEDPVAVRLRVRAAPWIDVTSLDLVVGGRTVQTIPIESQPTRLGPEEGSLDEARARSVRFEGELQIPVGPENTWVMAIARGTRRLDDAIPFMPVPPMAITNPVWITRDKSKLPIPVAGARDRQSVGEAGRLR